MTSGSLDVPYNKIAEWLSCRGKLPENWAVLLKGIERSVSDNLREAPPEDFALKEFLDKNENNFNYLKICDFVELLLNNGEAKKTNLIGQYTSPHITRWRKIVKLYKNKNLFLAEFHSNIVRNVSFQIPNCKKTIENAQKQITECIKKQGDMYKAESAAIQKYIQTCSNFNIKIPQPPPPSSSSSSVPSSSPPFADFPIINFDDALHAYVKSVLPLVLQKVAKLIQNNAGEIIQLYKTFFEFSCIASPPPNSSSSSVLTFLDFVKNEGNAELQKAAHLHTSLQEEASYTHKNKTKENKKEKKEDRKSNNAKNDKNNKEESLNGIDWGGENFSFDIQVVDGGRESGVNNNNNNHNNTHSHNEDKLEDASSGINWNFDSLPVDASSSFSSSSPSASSTSSSSSSSSSSAQMNSANMNGQIDEEDTKCTVLLCRKFRVLLLNDICEAKSFLLQRIKEQTGRTPVDGGRGMKTGGGGKGGKTDGGRGEGAADLIANTAILPCHLLVDASELERMLSFCNEVTEILSGRKTTQLLKLKSDPKYFYKTSSELSAMKTTYEKPRRSIQQLQQRISRLQDDISEAERRMRALREETLRMKKEAEEGMSSLFNSPVRLIGDISKI